MSVSKLMLKTRTSTFESILSGFPVEVRLERCSKNPPQHTPYVTSLQEDADMKRPPHDVTYRDHQKLILFDHAEHAI
jgi:hypothetical protein